MELVLIFMMVLYLLPSLAAHRRKHNNFPAIFILNILLGWTGLGWVLALIWAYTCNVSRTYNLE